MIRDKALWEQWETEELRRTPSDLMHNLRLVEGMYREAHALGVLRPREPDEGLDVKIAVARVLNVYRTP
jgi:hypothetical protein